MPSCPRSVCLALPLRQQVRSAIGFEVNPSWAPFPQKTLAKYSLLSLSFSSVGWE